MMCSFLSSNCMSQRLVYTLVMMILFTQGPIPAKSSCTMQDRAIDVGVVLDANSKSGKLMIAAIEVACHDHYSEYKLEINPRYLNSHGDPRRALSLAEELVGREEVQVIVWLDTWREESILSEISRRSRIPIISFNVSDGSRSWIRKHGDELKEFRKKLAKRFQQIYGAGEVKNFVPSINALRAHDCMTAIMRSFDDVKCEISTRKILEAEFMGLSGPIDLQRVAGLRLWSPTGTRIREREGDRRRETRVLQVAAKKKIGVPRRTTYDLFVKEEVDMMTRQIKYTGFCIDVFLAALQKLNITASDYEFVPDDGTYDELVEKVENQTYYGAVGDITILAKRSTVVEFTQPIMESSLSMIVRARPDPSKSFPFVKPFSPGMWAASGGVLLYTVFTVWALEHSHNGEFSGPLTQQLSTAMWFTFSSLFFAHREHIRHSPTRIMLVMWFFVALILTQSYTASLTSMLTLQNIKSSVPTIDFLRENKSTIGCGRPKGFVCNYLVKVLNFSSINLRHITDSVSYVDHLQNESISALFLESPYEKAFFTRYCQGYVSTPLSYRFGGFGFAFQKNSSLAEAISIAILQLSEKGNLSSLQNKWFGPGCTAGASTTTQPSLEISSFWMLFVLTIGTATCCLVLSCLFRRREGYLPNTSGSTLGSPTMEMTRSSGQ